MNFPIVLGLAAVALSLEGAPRPTPDVIIDLRGAGALFYRPLTNRLLASAGVNVSWDAKRPAPTASGLIIKIRLDTSAPLDYASGALALAHPFMNGVAQITVFINRVHALAASVGMLDYRLTAHVLAHEIAHVLQRLTHHSDRGIMKPKWDRADLATMGHSPLAFTPADIDLIRAGLESHRNLRFASPLASR